MQKECCHQTLLILKVQSTSEDSPENIMHINTKKRGILLTNQPKGPPIFVIIYRQEKII
jgi:hypothetical protein